MVFFFENEASLPSWHRCGLCGNRPMGFRHPLVTGAVTPSVQVKPVQQSPENDWKFNPALFARLADGDAFALILCCRATGGGGCARRGASEVEERQDPSFDQISDLRRVTRLDVFVLPDDGDHLQSQRLHQHVRRDASSFL